MGNLVCIMGVLSPKVAEKIQGPSWNGLRDKFLGMCTTILDVSPSAVGELTTVYVKFTPVPGPNTPVYAVAWLKNSKKWIVGLALPEDVNAPVFVPPPKRYAGLTRYFYVTPDDPIPAELKQWTELAYNNIMHSLN
ncbi:MAG: hypothetical protein G8D58_10335 [gamma proteobacterium symbiont of Phacoides pectinatus]